MLSTKAIEVFYSYADADEQLQKKLEKHLGGLRHQGVITEWHRRLVVPGSDWTQAIDEHIKNASIILLLISPDFLASDYCYGFEMHHALERYRANEAYVIPVLLRPVDWKGTPFAHLQCLPRNNKPVTLWRNQDEAFLNIVEGIRVCCKTQSNSQVTTSRLPPSSKSLSSSSQKQNYLFMVADLPTHFVVRSHEFEVAKRYLMSTQSDQPTIVMLQGAGGYGKTTLAQALCHDEQVQQVFDQGAIWVTLGENPNNLLGKVEDIIYLLSKERPGYVSLTAATTHLAELLANRNMLLVIDDVWNMADLQPFLQGGKRCARLITSRDTSVLLSNAQYVQVGAMSLNEAVQLLLTGLNSSADHTQIVRKLAERLGQWPILLKLVNGALYDRVHKYHLLLSDALTYIDEALDTQGLTAFDTRNPRDRSQAVEKTLSVSFGQLSTEEYTRYKELAIFPQGVDIPLSTLQKLWGTRGEMNDFDIEVFCEQLHRLSLLLNFDPIVRTIRLHDVLRTYLEQEGTTYLIQLHRQLLDAYPMKRWAELPHEEPYLWDYLAYHLIHAGRTEELISTLKDLLYIATKTFLHKAYAVETDLTLAERNAPSDEPLRLLKRNFTQMSHLLNRCETLPEVGVTLCSRLKHIEELSSLRQALERELSQPFLTPWHPLPDLPHPALVRTLRGHAERVTSCSISPKGDYIVSASYDGTLKIWDLRTGQMLLTLPGKKYAVSRDGDSIVSVSEDSVLKVYNAHSGIEYLTLRGHTAVVTDCVVSPKGDFIVSASKDCSLRVWDAHSGQNRFTLQGHASEVNSCAVSPQGDYIVSASKDHTLKVWDTRTGQNRFTLQGHVSEVNSCAVSPQGDYIVSASKDHTLKVWDTRTGQQRFTLQGDRLSMRGCIVSPSGEYILSAASDHSLKLWRPQVRLDPFTLTDLKEKHKEEITSFAVSPEGDYVVSASRDKTLKVWDLKKGKLLLTLEGHTDEVNACAISSDGNAIVSASKDHTLKVWDAHSGQERSAFLGHTDEVTSCAISSQGDYVVSTSNDHILKVWDIRAGKARFTLQGSRYALSPRGDYIVSALDNPILKVWDAQTGQEHLTLRGHTASVTDCIVSPNGDYIVSASDDCTLKVWDAHSGQERFTLWGHTDAVRSCAVSPDGDYIVSASDDCTLKVWDAHSGQERFTLRRHTDAVTNCTVNPKSTYIVSVSDDHTLEVWDAHSGQELFTLLDYIDWVTGYTVSPDGNYIVTIFEPATVFTLGGMQVEIAGDRRDRKLLIWDAHTGARTLTLQGHPKKVNACATSPRGDYIVSASNDHTLKIWDIQTGKERLLLQGHADVVTYCTVDSNGDSIISTSQDGTLKIWDSRALQERFNRPEYVGDMVDCAVSPLGDYVVSAQGALLRIWDAHTGKERFNLYNGFWHALQSCAVSPLGDYIVSTDTGGTTKVWNAYVQQDALLLGPGGQHATDCAVSPLGDYIVSTHWSQISVWNTLTAKRSVFLQSFITSFKTEDIRAMWDIHTGDESFALPGHTGWVNSCAISPSGDLIITASSDHTLKVWDTHTVIERLTLKGHSDRVADCTVSPSGDLIISACDDGTLKVWDIQTGIERHTLRGHTEKVTGCAVEPLEEYIVSTSSDGTVRVWDIHTGSCVTALHVDGDLSACSCFPDGESIVVAGKYGLYFLNLVRSRGTQHILKDYSPEEDPARKEIIRYPQALKNPLVREIEALVEEFNLLRLAIDVQAEEIASSSHQIIAALAKLKKKDWDIGQAIEVIWLGGTTVSTDELDEQEAGWVVQLLNIFAEKLYQMWWQGILETIDDNLRRGLLYNVVRPQIEMIGSPLRPLLQRLWAGERDLPILTQDLDELSRDLVEVILDLLAKSPVKGFINRIPILKMGPNYFFLFKYLMRIQMILLDSDLDQDEIDRRILILKNALRGRSQRDKGSV